MWQRILILALVAALAAPLLGACGKRTDPDWPDDVIQRPSRIPTDRNQTNIYR